MIAPSTLALVSGCVIVALAMLAGHYVFSPPRAKLHPITAYMYGVVFCAFVGPGLLAVVTGSWVLPLWVVWLMFAVAGIVTAGCYALDEYLAARNELRRTQRAAGNGPR